MARRLVMLVGGETSMGGWEFCLVRLCRRVWGLRRLGRRGRGVGLGRLLGSLLLRRRRKRRGRRVVLRDGEGSNRSARIEVWVEAGRVGRLVAGGRVVMMGCVLLVPMM